MSLPILSKEIKMTVEIWGGDYDYDDSKVNIVFKMNGIEVGCICAEQIGIDSELIKDIMMKKYMENNYEN